jgi:hypothetical protein
MNIFNIERAYKLKKERGWDKLYWCIDFHDTLFPARYDSSQTVEISASAIEVLNNIQTNNVLIAYTSTPEDHVSELCRDIYKYCGINFTYINDNPEYIGNDYADFSKKFYYNILLDDKAGFEGETDWLLVKNELIRVGEW